ncbi:MULTISPECIES: hypothetical protein [Rhizobium]|uniref:SLATT domain-containing protein n=2 Tax=Rhizobium TaxID=379 RepID=A0A7W9CXT1_9HYPH|nr:MULTISPECIES: hypothetical protein [Rhizobium]MBB4577278.1 hypothetical protein [Rhizobium lentis]MBB5553907.1 hypothetical protein [Rhizobium lentis]MBB5563833.1 hypothetical protein [Rhizobium lentis]MBB5570899.1 hypothetical protein [Rhizobium lentis]OWO90031.1 hypothetical protein B5E41_28990 [Rhizobium esperanzae]
MTNVEDDCYNEVHGIRHNTLRNALYHIARRAWLERVSRFLNLAVILGGTSYAAQVFINSPRGTFVLGLASATLGAVQLIFDFSGKAHHHERLQKRYYDLLASVEETRGPTMDDCAAWRAELTRIYADEPPTLRALDAIADNQATAATYGSSNPRLNVSFWQSWTRNLFLHNAGRFPERDGWRIQSDASQSAVEPYPR